MSTPPTLDYDTRRGRPLNRTLLVILAAVLVVFFLLATLFTYRSAQPTITNTHSGLRHIGVTPSTVPTTLP